MCGIFGWYSVNQEIDKDKAVSLTNLLTHRGPDSLGYYCDRKVFLGHRRLKIIDLSDEANQPFTDRSGRYKIIFNGEIYNYIELREKIIQASGSNPVVFTTTSDTEVLLYAYLLWGETCLEYLEGMFAFAVYDMQENSLFLCRDHLGQKPLYYYHDNRMFVFASELRVILEHPSIQKRLDVRNILQFHAYDIFPYENTPLEHVYKLLPGCYLEYANNRIRKRRYWDSVPGQDNRQYSLTDALENLDSLFTRSLKKHIRSDVPVGVFLSGGADSSLVTYYAQKALGDRPLHAYNVGFNYANFNESEVARVMAGSVNARFKEFQLHEEDIKTSIDEILGHIDEPLADPGLINSYFLSKKARDYITVALAGDGGDELFAGYITFQAVDWFMKYARIPQQFFHLALFLIKLFYIRKNSYMSIYFKLKQFIRGISCKDAVRLPAWLSTAAPGQIQKLYNSSFLREHIGTQPIDHSFLFEPSMQHSKKVENQNLEHIMLYQYQKYFLPEFVLGHTDRASMACSLEVRCPILDKNIIEFANALPLHLKVKGKEIKKILFHLMDGNKFPHQVTRHKKQGFTFPVAAWLRTKIKNETDRLREFIHADNGNMWNRDYIHKLLDEHESNKDNHYRILWNLIVYSKWWKKYNRYVSC